MKKLISKICLSLVISLFFTLTLVPQTVSAGDEYNLTDGHFDVTEHLSIKDKDNETNQTSYFDTDENKGQTNSPIINFIVSIIEVATTIIGTIAMIILIIGGFQLMAAQGNQQELDSAKDTLKYAVIGLVLAFMSYIVVLFVQSIFLTSVQ